MEKGVVLIHNNLPLMSKDTSCKILFRVHVTAVLFSLPLQIALVICRKKSNTITRSRATLDNAATCCYNSDITSARQQDLHWDRFPTYLERVTAIYARYKAFVCVHIGPVAPTPGQFFNLVLAKTCERTHRAHLTFGFRSSACSLIACPSESLRSHHVSDFILFVIVPLQ